MGAMRKNVADRDWGKIHRPHLERVNEELVVRSIFFF
jgi:hypothetical protein